MQEQRRVRRRVALALAVAVLGVVGTACAGSGTSATGTSATGSSATSSSTTGDPATPSTAASPDPSTTASPTNSPQAPTDGVTLSEMGFVHGPAQFVIPRGASITTASDQENTVTLVIAAPTAPALADYFRRTLPATGFTITGDRVEGDTATLAFSGGGWRGSFTGRGAVSGITLMRGSA